VKLNILILCFVLFCFCCHGVLLFINVLNDSLRRQDERVERVERHMPHVVTYEEGKAMAKKLGAYKYMECSALTGENFEETMNEAVNAALGIQPKKGCVVS